MKKLAVVAGIALGLSLASLAISVVSVVVAERVSRPFIGVYINSEGERAFTRPFATVKEAAFAAGMAQGQLASAPWKRFEVITIDERLSEVRLILGPFLDRVYVLRR